MGLWSGEIQSWMKTFRPVEQTGHSALCDQKEFDKKNKLMVANNNSTNKNNNPVPQEKSVNLKMTTIFF